MVRGVIYMYTSPSGKSYIGQTVDERRRRNNWFSSSYSYAGDAINRARAKYGRDAFIYTVLYTHVFTSKEEAKEVLDTLEKHYISKYDTKRNGYNCDNGGGNHFGYKLSEKSKQNIIKGLKSWVSTPEGRKKLSEARRGKHRKKGYRIESHYIPIVQLTLNGEFLREFPSIRDAGEYIGTNSCRVNIGNVCKGKRDSAEGYKWMYRSDYYDYFLHPDKEDIPQRVQSAINDISKRNSPKIKKKYKCKPVPKKEGPKINSHAQQVAQYGENLELVKVWRCATEASKQLGIWQSNISRAIRTKGMYMGTYWRNYNGQDKCEPKPKKKIEHRKQRKKIVQKTMNGEVVNVHESVTAASKSFGKTNNVLINKALHGRAKTAYGYVWEYLNCA